MKPCFFSLLLLVWALMPTGVVGQEPGQVCVTGYGMDNYCILLGTLLDDGSLPTLAHPDKHSIHCLVDIGQCVGSGYEVLTEPRDTDGNFVRAYELDEHGNDLLVREARRVGKSDECYTCDGTGTQGEGFQATFVGTIDPDYDDFPALLRVEEIYPHTTRCETLLVPAPLPPLPEKAALARTPTSLRNGKLDRGASSDTIP